MRCVPLSAVKTVTVEPRAVGEVEGTLAPVGRGFVGALERGGASVMYAVSPTASEVLVVHLHKQEYSMLVLGVKDPEAAAKEIRAAHPSEGQA